MRVNSMRVLMLSVFFAAALTTWVSADELHEAVDSIAKDAIESDSAVGLSVAVAEGDEILLAKGYGLANVELQSAANAKTVYRIGSITKQLSRSIIGLPWEGLQSTIPYLPNPVIASVQGDAIGGGNVLAFLYDLTIASESAVSGQVGHKVGPGLRSRKQESERSRRSGHQTFANTGSDVLAVLLMAIHRYNSLSPAEIEYNQRRAGSRLVASSDVGINRWMISTKYCIDWWALAALDRSAESMRLCS